MNEWWKKVIRDYFTFSTGERNGVIVLCFTILVAAFAPRIYLLFQKEEPVDFGTFNRQIDSLKMSLERSAADSAEEAPSLAELDKEVGGGKNSVTRSPLFTFDPNTATADDFRKLGLREQLIKTILNYRNKGGKFFAAKDFQKIYGLRPEDYAHLEPYIQVTQQKDKYAAQSTRNPSPAADAPSKLSLLDLNKADSIQLVALPGIGAVLTSRILRFRNKLGGFYSIDQLKEVYGLTPETLDEVAGKITVNPADVKRININEATISDLRQHPYFKSIATPLINYRDQHGGFKTLEDLKNVDVLTEEAFQKIERYIAL